MRHYARGVALANTDRIEEARSELAAFDEAVKQLDGIERWLGNQPAEEIMPMARLVLEGEIEFKAGNQDRGLDLLLDYSAPIDKRGTLRGASEPAQRLAK